MAIFDPEILSNSPLSGVYEEHNFAGTATDTLWVKFVDRAYLEWVGVFAIGQARPNTTLINLSRPCYSFLVAGGQGYMINADTHCITLTTEWYDIEDVIYHEASDHVVATNGLNLALYNHSDTLWKSQRIAASDLHFNGQCDRYIKGTLNDLTTENCPFQPDVMAQEIISDSQFPPEVHLAC